jgi:alpha-tubulin suppressor-like RCC1 family protein
MIQRAGRPAGSGRQRRPGLRRGLDLVAVAGLSGVTAIALGPDHACAVGPGGEVRCWGANDWGQLGDGTAEPRSTPVVVAGLPAPATGLAAAAGRSCARLAGGAVLCWGGDHHGQLGDDAPGLGWRAAAAPALGLKSEVTALAAGRGHACALLAGGAVRCWGSNFAGQVGDGTGSDAAAPVAVAGLGGASAVTAGAGIDEDERPRGCGPAPLDPD